MTASTTSLAPAAGVDATTLRGLRRWNIGLSVLHAAQVAAVLALASDFAITITSSLPAGPPGTELPPAEPLSDVRIGVAIAAFLALAALDHLLVGTTGRDSGPATPSVSGRTSCSASSRSQRWPGRSSLVP